MRVLLASSGSGSRGGGEIFLDYLGMGLVRLGHDVIVWIPSHPRMDELARRCERFARVVRAPYTSTYDRPGRSLSAALSFGASSAVARQWQALAPDVVHVNKQNLEDGLDLLRAARLCGRPTVCTIHLTQTALYLRAKVAALRDLVSRRSLARYPGILVAVQPARAAALRDLLPSSARVRMVYNGAPAIAAAVEEPTRAKVRLDLGVADHDILLAGVGRLVAQKNPVAFLETASQIHARVPRARFVWVGDGDMRNVWESWIAERGLDRVIQCVGWQSNPAPYVAAADGLLHVAEFEGLPLALVEAMAAGKPCFVSRSFAAEITLLDDGNVVFVDDLENACHTLADPLELARVANSCRVLAERHFSIESMASGYTALYQEAA